MLWELPAFKMSTAKVFHPKIRVNSIDCELLSSVNLVIGKFRIAIRRAASSKKGAEGPRLIQPSLLTVCKGIFKPGMLRHFPTTTGNTTKSWQRNVQRTWLFCRTRLAGHWPKFRGRSFAPGVERATGSAVDDDLYGFEQRHESQISGPVIIYISIEKHKLRS